VTNATRYGAAMLRQFGWFYTLLGFGRLLGRIRLEEPSAERIRAAAALGPVVYVLLRRSSVDLLALNTALNQRRLPISAWSNGFVRFWWQPVIDAWRELWGRLQARWREGPSPDPLQSGWLAAAVAGGETTALFLQPGVIPVEWLGTTLPDPLAAILDAQRATERPIQLVPVLVVWDRSPDLHGDAVQWFLGGNSEAPGIIGELRNVYERSGDAFVQVAEPVDLRELTRRIPEAQHGRALRALLRRYLHRESTLVRGPRLLPFPMMKRLVLDNPPMRELARREADAAGKTPEQVRHQMDRDYDRIAANFRWWVVAMLKVVLRPLWTRLYRGVDVRPEDLERIRDAMRHGTAVLVPSHKSHLDYLLLSWVLHQHDLIVPHVVAGINLAIWPVSVFLRGAGGFFIQRGFKGDRVYPAVFARYLRELIRQGYPVEFFIEGGRTRSGKLLPPKVGVLGMVFDSAELMPRDQEVTLLPIAFAYEQVAEEGAYARELGGEAKKAESVGQLVQARSVLRRRLGRVYLRVGEPVRCSPWVRGPTPWSRQTRNEHKETLHRVGEQLIHRIGQVTVVLPTSLVAMALLADHRRGVLHEELVDRVARFRALLVDCGAPEADSLSRLSQATVDALARFARMGAVSRVEHPQGTAWAIEPSCRIQLDFHKNQAMHFLAPTLYAVAAIRSRPDGAFTAAELRTSFSFVAWLFRREFILDPERSLEQALAQGLASLIAFGGIAADDASPGGYTVASPARLGELLGLIRSLLEAYWVAVSDLPRWAGNQDEEVGRALLATPLERLPSRRPEALTLVNLQNAAATLREDGLVAQDPSGAWRVDDRLRQVYLDRLSAMVL
jgi:glycerol-3-phosphate O-acyltransferase